MRHGGENLLQMQVGIGLQDLGQFRIDRLGGADFGGPLGLENLERHGTAAVPTRDTHHFLDAIVDIGNFTQTHELAARNGNLRVSQCLGGLRRAQYPDVLFAAADLGGSMTSSKLNTMSSVTYNPISTRNAISDWSALPVISLPQDGPMVVALMFSTF